MADAGILVSPDENPEHAKLWNETWKRLDHFLPGMFKEVFPEPRQKNEKSAQAAATVQEPVQQSAK